MKAKYSINETVYVLYNDKVQAGTIEDRVSDEYSLRFENPGLKKWWKESEIYETYESANTVRIYHRRVRDKVALLLSVVDNLHPSKPEDLETFAQIIASMVDIEDIYLVKYGVVLFVRAQEIIEKHKK